MEQLEVSQRQVSSFSLSVTDYQYVMDFEGGTLTGMVREGQVQLIWIKIWISYVPRSPPDSVHHPGSEKVVI